jgi:Fe2+ transport system protein B
MSALKNLRRKITKWIIGFDDVEIEKINEHIASINSHLKSPSQMSSDKDLERLKQEIELIEKQKEKNKLRAEDSEQQFIKKVMESRKKDGAQKFKAYIYTAIAFFAFIINPVFGVFVFFVIVVDIIFNPFKW